MISLLNNVLSASIANEGKQIYITSNENVINPGGGNDMPCFKEEADSRIVIHVIHAIESGYLSISIRTVDSDVLVILVGHFATFLSINPTLKLWVAFGTGKDFRIFSINQIFSDLGE